MKLFGVQIVYGMSPEARVFASLLANRPDALVPTVLMHDRAGEREPAKQFAEAARCDVIPVDTGWRINTSGRRGAPDRIVTAIKYWSRLPHLARLAEAINPDIVYSCQQHYDCRAATYIASRLNKPQVIHLHYIIGPWLKKAVLQRLLTCDHVVTVSDFIRDEALRHGVRPDRVTTIRNAMTPLPAVSAERRAAIRAQLGVAGDTLVYGIVSRLDPGKGHADTIAAFAKAAIPDAVLVVVGSGSLDGELRAAAAASGAAETVVFTGRRSDVPDLLGAMDIFVHPSRLDPCPLALLEAMSAALPVVAYAEGGAKEMIVDGITGILAPPGDVDALAESMRLLARDRFGTAAMGTQGRTRIAMEFRPEDAALKFAQLLGTLA